MPNHPKWILITLILISVAFFVILLIPNAKASENIAMVSMFEPDEGIMVPVIQKMIAPKESLKHFIYYFAAYEYYYYGFPFFALSAIPAFFIQWANQLGNIPLVMTSFRQLISVLPTLFALLLLVYMHDRFKTYRSIVLYVFLLTIPAVVRNGFWWHPDGVVLLLSVLVLYLLYRDNHKLGSRFLAAAFVCGILTATKIVGVYFFLAVGLAVIWSLVNQEVTWKKAVIKSLLFILIMGATFIVANPFLLLEGHRTLYINTFQKQTLLLSEGYGILYNKGLKAAWPVMQLYYGEAFFLLATLGISIWNITKKRNPFLHSLTIAWFLPLTISILTYSHFKFQYWLPAAIPLFASWATIFPRRSVNLKPLTINRVLKIILLLIFMIQFVLFGLQSSQMLIKRTQRESNNPEIAFYDLAMQQLEPIGSDPVYAYYDYRLYMPPKANWVTETSFDLLDYDFIRGRNYDVLLLLQQRILDYLHPSAVGVDPDAFARAQAFYQDANEGSIDDYVLLFRNETALLFVRHDFCLRYFEASICQ